MRAKSFQASSIEQTAVELANARSDGFEPTLAFVFVASNWDRGDLRSLFNDHEIQVFGATTYGEFTNGAYQLDSTAVLLPPTHLRSSIERWHLHRNLMWLKHWQEQPPIGSRIPRF